MIKLPVVPTTPISVVTTSSQGIINAWKEYATTRELETTKREQIRANRDVALAQIQAQAEALRTLIAGSFAERAVNFDRYFALLESGFASGDDQQINAALTLIVEQTKVSPMAQATKLLNKINDPDDDDVIEI